MVEWLRHITGTCGEGHPSILYLTPFLLLLKNKIVRGYSIVKLILKTYLKRF